MYACTQCEKTYASQNSLTRHVHVHAQSKKHTCSVCRLVFYRKDLLSRHSRLHERRPTEESTLAEAHNGRQRCHTACTRCRELRTKCDGHRPCISCSKTGAQCQDGRRSNRLSHLPANSERSSKDQQQEQLPENHENSPLLESPQLADADMAMDFQESIHDSDSQQAFNPQADHLFPDLQIQNTRSDVLGTGPAPFLNDMVSWPWLHEELFLPAPLNPFSNVFDSSGVQSFGSNSLPASGWEGLTQGLPLQDLSTSNAFAGQAQRENPLAPMFHDSVSSSDHDINTANLRTAAQAQAARSDRTPAAVSRNPPGPGKDSPHCENYRRNSQTRTIHDLITWASALDSNNQDDGSREAFLQTMSATVVETFGLVPDSGISKSHMLHHFCEMYAQHFGPLWPLLSPQTLNFDALHPLLFLGLTAVGSMYCGSSASKYGAMMHTQICNTLIVPLVGHDDGENDFIWLAQARLLTQVAALYFGQPKAFTYAQHLGVLLVAQARRIDLFSAAQSLSLLQKFYRMRGVASDQERLAVWMQLEARRRLAFGIFRGDTYTSVLLHTKPLVSLEEIDLELPMCDSVWQGEGMAAGLCVQMIEHDPAPCRELRASDIYRIALDRHEPIPLLDSFGQELLIFGLQYPVWRFSRDQKMIERLTGREDRMFGSHDPTALPQSSNNSANFTNPELFCSPLRHPQSRTGDSEAHRVESALRVMADLELERSRLLSALEKWEKALPLVKNFVRTKLERSALLSGLILYHVGYLSLYAPLRDLHQIQYHLADNRPIDPDLLVSIRHWANSRRGRLAAERACNMWSLIARESQVAKEKRLNFNLLAFAALHHGAVILWSYAGAHDFTLDLDAGVSPLSLEGSNDTIMVHRDESTRMLQSFVELYDYISPARWSSFAKAADRLAHQPFPPCERG